MKLVKKIREKIRALTKPAPAKRSPEEAEALIQERIMKASEKQFDRIKKPHRISERKPGRR